MPHPSILDVVKATIDGEEYAVLVIALRGAVATLPELTKAEHDVARLLLEGLSNEEIAVMRGASARTVANQIQSLYRKLGVRSRAELARRMHR